MAGQLRLRPVSFRFADDLPGASAVPYHSGRADDVERSRRFYTDVLGGKVVFSGEPTDAELSNSWIIINVGEDRPMTSLRSPWRRRAIPIG